MPDVATVYTAFFGRLRDAADDNERLSVLGHGSVVGGTFALRPDLRALLESAKTHLTSSLDAGATRVEAISRLADAAEAAGVTADETTFVLYAAYPESGEQKLYVGETAGTVDGRWRSHPNGCPLLTSAISATVGGKGRWICRPILALPENSRSKDLLLYFEEAIQRHLETKGTPWGLNYQYGRGTFDGAADDDSWLSNYVGVIEFIGRSGKFPSQNAIDPDIRKLGKWVHNQRMTRAQLSTHRAKALEAIRCWKWSVKASPKVTAEKIAVLRTNKAVVDSEGWLMPKNDRGVVDIRQTLKGKTRCVITNADRADIENHLPGLLLSGHEALFRWKAVQCSRMYVSNGVFELPASDSPFYHWIFDIRRGAVSLSPERVSFLESIGMGEIVLGLKPLPDRAVTRMHNDERNFSKVALDSKRRRICRELEISSIRDSVASGPASSQS